MHRLLLFLLPFLMAPDCGGGGPSFGGGGTPPPSDDADDTDGSGSGGGGNLDDCEPEYQTVEVSCSEGAKTDTWHIYVVIDATCPWVDVAFDGTSYGGVITGSDGVFEGDLDYTGAACDEPHTLDFECLYMMSNYDCSYEYSP